jgi:hypothetical protein
LIPILLSELQVHHGHIVAHQQQVSALTAENERLRAALEEQRTSRADLAMRIERLESQSGQSEAKNRTITEKTTAANQNWLGGQAR